MHKFKANFEIEHLTLQTKTSRNFSCSTQSWNWLHGLELSVQSAVGQKQHTKKWEQPMFVDSKIKRRMVSWVANVHNYLCSKSSWCSFNGQRIYFLVLLLSIILFYLFNYLLDDLSFCGSFPLIFVSNWIHRTVLMCTFLMCSFAKKKQQQQQHLWFDESNGILAKQLFHSLSKMIICWKGSSLRARFVANISNSTNCHLKNGERITV